MWLFLWLPLVAAGQEAVSVTGRVTDWAGRSVGFATVRVADAGVGTGADAEGRYELRLPAGRYVLEASAVGYVAARQEVRAEGKAVVVDFRLVEETRDEQSNPVFYSEVYIAGRFCARGKGYTKKESHQLAAREALSLLESDAAFSESLSCAAREEASPVAPDGAAAEAGA